MDYTLARHSFSVKESLEFSSSHSGLLTGVGMGFVLLLFVPVVGWAIGPTIGVIASTLAVVRCLSDHQKKKKES